MRITQVAVAAAACTLAVSGCSGDDDGAHDRKEPGSTQASGVISPSDLPADVELRKPTGIIDDTDVEECSTDSGKAQAHGTVQNSAKKAKDLVITVNWVVGSGDVIARSIAKLEDVAPGVTKTWSVEVTLPDQSGITCVPSAQAGQLK